MDGWICVTCGVQFPDSAAQPAECPICLDQRQYIGHQGQQWTTLAAMRQNGYRNELRRYEDGITGIGTEPRFAIGQRAVLVQAQHGNVLWDCVSYLDDATVEAVTELGGISAIAISHPHFYSSIGVWADRFDARIYLHAANQRYVMRPSNRIHYWDGDSLKLDEGVTLARLGGHFAGSTMMHWDKAADGRGAIFTGDTIQVVEDYNWVTFMYSYPNQIPLPAATVRRIADTAATYPFDRLYGGWWDKVVQTDARNAVLRSADRYIGALERIAPES